MYKFILNVLFFFLFLLTSAQTDLTEAVDFHVKAVSGETIKLFPILDNEAKIVVIDFFSTTCGPCQDYAPDFQAAYEIFGENNGNVFFLGINTNNDNEEVFEFDSIFGLNYPNVSGLQGGGDIVYSNYNIQSYPTVIVITPDHQVVEQFIWPPSTVNIVDAVYAHGGIITRIQEMESKKSEFNLFPNPASSNVSLICSLESQMHMEYEIINLSGNLVYCSEKIFLFNKHNTLDIPVEKLKNGTYFVKIKSDKIPLTVLKLIVEQ